MASVEVTLHAQADLDRLIITRELPATARERVSRSLLTLEQFPLAGRELPGAWQGFRALIGPWGWLIVVYTYVEDGDKVVIIAFHDGRTSSAATSEV